MGWRPCIGSIRNPATDAKGINLLVADGILYEKRGIGMFVSTGAGETIKDKRTKTFTKKFIKPLLEEAISLGITPEKFIGMLKEERSK